VLRGRCVGGRLIAQEHQADEECVHHREGHDRAAAWAPWSRRRVITNATLKIPSNRAQRRRLPDCPAQNAASL
jgi:hypothetical protein